MTTSRGIGRGGRRPGAGRKPKLVTAPLIEVAATIRRDVSTTSRENRIACVLASHGCTDQEIAAALDLPEATTREFYGKDIAVGRSIASANITHILMERAKAGNVSAMSVALKRLDLMEARSAAWRPARPYAV